MFQYNKILDLNKLYSNDIHAMADNYGIEAAYNVLIKVLYPDCNCMVVFAYCEWAMCIQCMLFFLCRR